MQLMNTAIPRDRDCSNMCLHVFHMTSTIINWHAKNRWKLEIAFPSMKEWNESEYRMIVSGVSELMNIFGHTSLFECVSVIAYPLLAADYRSVRHDLLII
jgi:hypothetical protein